MHRPQHYDIEVEVHTAMSNEQLQAQHIRPVRSRDERSAEYAAREFDAAQLEELLRLTPPLAARGVVKVQKEGGWLQVEVRSAHGQIVSVGEGALCCLIGEPKDEVHKEMRR